MPFTKFVISTDVIINRNLLIVTFIVPFWTYYTVYRFDEVIFSALGATCVIAMLIPAVSVLTYVACDFAASIPLQDGSLAGFDERLGFRWPEALAWADQHPFLMVIGRWAYRSVPYQTPALILILSATRQTRRLQTVIYAFTIGIIICSAISAFVPALGAYTFYGISVVNHEHIDLVSMGTSARGVLALRAGGFGVLSAGNADGIITFPSFHTVLGILFIWAFWGTRYLRWWVLALNGAMIVATPLHGSHYLSDILAGAAIAIGAILASTRLHSVVGGTVALSPAVFVRKVGTIQDGTNKSALSDRG